MSKAAFLLKALVLLFGESAVNAAINYDRYNYRDHPDYIHVAEGDDARLTPVPPPIDCAREFKDNDNEVGSYLVSVNQRMHAFVSAYLCEWMLVTGRSGWGGVQLQHASTSLSSLTTILPALRLMRQSTPESFTLKAGLEFSRCARSPTSPRLSSPSMFNV